MPTWRELQAQFFELHQMQTVAIGRELLSVRIIRDDPSNEWAFQFEHGPSTPYVQQRFRQIATDTGSPFAGHIPDGVTPLEFWLDRLFRHCKMESKMYVVTEHVSGGGSLCSVCEASATYCAWLDVDALEAMSLGSDGQLHRIVAPLAAAYVQENLRGYITALDNVDDLVNKKKRLSKSQWLSTKLLLHEIREQLQLPEPPDKRPTLVDLRTEIHSLRGIVDGKTRKPSSDIGTGAPESSRDETQQEPIIVPRIVRTIYSPNAAKRMIDFMNANGLSQPKFAEMAKTTDRTIRSFGSLCKVRKDIFSDIAGAMGLTPDELLKSGK